MKHQEQEQISKNNDNDEEIDILKLRDDFKTQSEELATLKNKLGEYETQLNLKDAEIQKARNERDQLNKIINNISVAKVSKEPEKTFEELADEMFKE